tara:strand:- start:2025 stop:3095 length:1071 start_codon:yes stop_codon:yes gene_type:complete
MGKNIIFRYEDYEEGEAPSRLKSHGNNLLQDNNIFFDGSTNKAVELIFDEVLHERIVTEINKKQNTKISIDISLADAVENIDFIDDYEHKIHYFKRYLISFLDDVFSRSNGFRHMIGEEWESKRKNNLTLYPYFFHYTSQLTSGIPKEWQGDRYSPVSISEIKEHYAEYRKIKWMKNPLFDLFFLKLFLYDHYSTSYYSLLFEDYKGLPGMRYPLTQGNPLKELAYKLTSFVMKIGLRFAIPIYAIYYLVIPGLMPLTGLGVAGLYLLYLIFLPISLYRKWKNYSPIKKRLEKALEKSLLTFVDVQKGLFNPKQIKLMMTSDGKEPSIFATTEIYTIVDDMIRDYGDYFAYNKFYN